MDERYTVVVPDGRTFWSDLGHVLALAEAERPQHPSTERLRGLWHQVGEELQIAEQD